MAMVISLQIPTIFWTSGRIPCVSYGIHMQLVTETHKAHPLELETNSFEVEIATEKLKMYNC
jgi:hypothetical protein